MHSAEQWKTRAEAAEQERDQLRERVRVAEMANMIPCPMCEGGKKRDYRDRLDRGVLRLIAGYGYPTVLSQENVTACISDAVKIAAEALAAVDAALEARR